MALRPECSNRDSFVHPPLSFCLLPSIYLPQSSLSSLHPALFPWLHPTLSSFLPTSSCLNPTVITQRRVSTLTTVNQLCPAASRDTQSSQCPTYWSGRGQQTNKQTNKQSKTTVQRLFCLNKSHFGTIYTVLFNLCSSSSLFVIYINLEKHIKEIDYRTSWHVASSHVLSCSHCKCDFG